MTSKKILSVAVGCAMAASVSAPALTFAAATSTATATPLSNSSTATSTTPTIAALQAELQKLLAQVQALTAQLIQVRAQVASTTLAIQQQLHVGSRGPAVTMLQRFLAGNPAIYPQGLVTGYYGPLTEEAVKRFQKDNGIQDVGEVGPQTRSVLNAYLANATSTSPRAIRHLLKRLMHHERHNERFGGASATTTGNGVPLVVMCHRAGNSGTSQTITVAGPSVFAHLRQGDRIGDCSTEGEHQSEHGNSQGESHGRGEHGFFQNGFFQHRSESNASSSESVNTNSESGNTTASSSDATSASTEGN